jgi:hypothetical protein
MAAVQQFKVRSKNTSRTLQKSQSDCSGNAGAGRTKDIDRPLSFVQDADDISVLAEESWYFPGGHLRFSNGQVQRLKSQSGTRIRCGRLLSLPQCQKIRSATRVLGDDVEANL